MFPALLSGFLLGASLIIAIGAQNAFILRMGLIRNHIFWLCLVCSLSDALLIALGVAGMGAVVSGHPAMLKVVALAGAVFLAIYAALSFKRALRPEALLPTERKPMQLRSALAMCLALTFLNPHVYLDTVILIGAVSSTQEGEARIAFAAGAMAASFAWFFGLGYGARLLAPLFARRLSWQVLDFLIAAVMAALSLSLLREVFA
ncbi:MAG: amino acid transporter [Nitratireductor sp.]|nr:amino acid transporter [Nitratireductor sp.]